MEISRSTPSKMLTTNSLSPQERLYEESQSIRVKNLSGQQLAELRQYQGQVLGDIDCVLTPTDKDPKPVDKLELLKTQDPDAYVAFTQLPAEAQSKFKKLLKEMPLAPSGMGMMGMMGGKPRLDPSLLNLLKSGKLTKCDSQNNSLLDNLCKLCDQDMGPGLSNAGVLRELVATLDDPGRLTQGNRGTCGPATIEHLQATRDPAEYARIVAGLTSKEGTVTMRNGDTLKRDRGSLAADDSGRYSTSRIYQAAMMEYANGETEYDNRTDEHTREDDSTYSGIYDHEFEKAVDALFGDKYDVEQVSHRPLDDSITKLRLRKAIEQGEQVPVALNFGVDPKDTDSGHFLLLVGMTDSKVTLRNPWGGHETGQDSDGPKREVIKQDGTIEMDLDDFLSRLTSIAMPKSVSLGLKMPPKAPKMWN